MATMSRTRRAAMLVGALMVAGCAASADEAAPPSASSGAPSEAALAIVTEDASEADDVAHLAAMAGPWSDTGTMGAGCAVEDEEPLSDGAWFGFVVDYTATSLTLDIACVYGPETDQFHAFAAAEHSPSSSYVVVNDVVAERLLIVTGDTEVYLRHLDGTSTDAATAAETLDPAAVGEHLPVWVDIEDGRAVAIVQPAEPAV